MDVLVVGGGMAGLRAATARHAAGDVVRVVDKGRRHGGRMATRTVEDAVLDPGVIDLGARGPELRAALTGWASEGLVAPAAHAPDRWRGTPTMRALPEALAARSGARVDLATTVTALGVRDGRWEATLTSGGTEVRAGADALVLTIPAPQALALLRTEPGLASERTLTLLEEVTYEPCLTVLARPADRTLRPAGLPAHAHDALRGTDLVRLHRADLDGSSPAVALTLQADPRFSAAHLDGDRDAAADHLVRQAEGIVGTRLEVVYVHGWRYAQVTRAIGSAALRDDTAGAALVLAGDLFDAAGGTAQPDRAEGVERAFLSGAAAAALLDGEGP